MQTTATPAAEAGLITLKYIAAVYVAAGWRSVPVIARARPLGRGGLAQVTEVLAVGGHAPDTTWASRTGANRQGYSPAAISNRELGKRKRVSACHILD